VDFYLRTILIFLAIIVTGIIITYYAFIMNVAAPLAEMMPDKVDSYAGSDAVSRETWVVNSSHLSQAVISRQSHHDVLLAWDNGGVANPANIPHLHLAMRFQELDDGHPDWAAIPESARTEIILRGGYILLHPGRDTTALNPAPWENPPPCSALNCWTKTTKSAT